MVKEQASLKNLKKDEFLHGKRPDGSLIGSYRSLGYATEKYKKNPLAGFPNVDLISTGAFANSARVSPRKAGNRYNFIFSDSKSADLIRKYGNDITGLNQETFNNFLNTKIRPLAIREIANRIT